MADASLPRVLVLGGLGFVGRHLVSHLVGSGLASYVKVVDKSMPALAYLSDEHKAVFQAPGVKVVQADLAREQHARERAFEGEEAPFDVVFNLCGETRYGLSDEDYRKKTLQPAEVCGAEALRTGAGVWLELSSAQVYQAGGRAPADEAAPVEPWTTQATFRHRAEQALRALETKGLRLVVLRAALVYGPGDLTSLTPRIACAAVYQRLGDKMKFLWDKDLRLNTVHVADVARACWLAARGAPPGSVFNLADAGDLSQGRLNEHLAALFGIRTGFLGTIVSNLAKLHLSGVAETANEKHVPGWFDLCAEHKIDNTPISPFVDKELMRRNSLHVDGRRAAAEIPGFSYEHTVDEAEIRAQIEAAIAQGHFPPILKG